MKRLQSARNTVRLAVAELARPGESTISGTALAGVLKVVVTAAILTTNIVGACAVTVIALFVVPVPHLGNAGHIALVNGIATAVYVAIAMPVGTAIGLRQQQPYIPEERPATLAETLAILRAPLRLFWLQVWLWLIAAGVFGAINLSYSTTLGIRVTTVVVITGLVTAALGYLLADLALRPAAARALSDRSPGKLVVPGVATRSLLAWMLGTGLPIVGVIAIGTLALTGDPASTRHKLGVAMVVLGGVGFSVGLLAVTVAARMTADPVDSVRRALATVQKGDLDIKVPVYDGTQIGQLQLGFNEMVAGLRERERIREAFGTYVDPEIAERILAEGTDLRGEEIEVTIMFIDIRGFTPFAERTPADQVVAALNELFEQFVAAIQEQGGHVDKFVGDGLLAVFGAPRRLPDHADKALEAALRIDATLHSTANLQIGIGLNSGTVLAGNIGGAGRLEFSVIGDPVNVAARVEAATRQTGDTILIAERTRELLTGEHPPLTERPGVTLKGKSDPVRVFTPDTGARRLRTSPGAS